MFCYPDNRREVYEVFDAFDYYHLLDEIDKSFIRLLRWLPCEKAWLEIKK